MTTTCANTTNEYNTLPKLSWGEFMPQENEEFEITYNGEELFVTGDWEPAEDYTCGPTITVNKITDVDDNDVTENYDLHDIKIETEYWYSASMNF